MSKKAKINKLEAANGKLAHEYRISEMARRMLIDDRRKFEHDLLMAKNEIEKLVDALNVSDSYAAHLQAQVDELQESLGESQAGRAGGIVTNTIRFNDAPLWLVDEVNAARVGLGINPAWRIAVGTSHKPHDLEKADGATDADPVLMMASLEFKPSVDKGDKMLVWHEVAHVLLSPIVEMAVVGLNEMDNKRLAQFVLDRINDAEEQVIANLVGGIFRDADV